MGDTKLNFDVLREKGLTAISCSNEYQAQVLLDEMFRQYPELVRKYWSNKDHKWYFYDRDAAYATHIYDDEASTMQVGSKRYWISEGYCIVDFECLVIDQYDLGEICATDFDISSFLGMEL